MTLTELLKTMKERVEKATPGPWVFGGWTIYDEDREAQKRKEPHWTLTNDEFGADGLMKGPIGRKALDVEYIISGSGYECDGLNLKEGDANFIAHARTDVPRLIAALEFAEKQLTAYEQLIVSLEKKQPDVIDFRIYPASQIILEILTDGGM